MCRGSFLFALRLGDKVEAGNVVGHREGSTRHRERVAFRTHAHDVCADRKSLKLVDAERARQSDYRLTEASALDSDPDTRNSLAERIRNALPLRP